MAKKNDNTTKIIVIGMLGFLAWKYLNRPKWSVEAGELSDPVFNPGPDYNPAVPLIQLVPDPFDAPLVDSVLPRPKQYIDPDEDYSQYNKGGYQQYEGYLSGIPKKKKRTLALTI